MNQTLNTQHSTSNIQGAGDPETNLTKSTEYPGRDNSVHSANSVFPPPPESAVALFKVQGSEFISSTVSGMAPSAGARAALSAGSSSHSFASHSPASLGAFTLTLTSSALIKLAHQAILDLRRTAEFIGALTRAGSSSRASRDAIVRIAHRESV